MLLGDDFHNPMVQNEKTIALLKNIDPLLDQFVERYNQTFIHLLEKEVFPFTFQTDYERHQLEPDALRTWLDRNCLLLRKVNPGMTPPRFYWELGFGSIHLTAKREDIVKAMLNSTDQWRNKTLLKYLGEWAFEGSVRGTASFTYRIHYNPEPESRDLFIYLHTPH